ncbi:MAG: CoA-binding protein [Pseudomonadota bacterium]
MADNSNLDVFLNPRTVAVLGATDRPGAWGSFIMGALLSEKFPGVVYPVNRKGGRVWGLEAAPRLESIAGPVDLAVLCLPEEFLEETIEACGKKGVKGLIIITAGLGETSPEGRRREKALAETARSYGLRLLGPNVSGVFNLFAGFNASAGPTGFIHRTELAAVCQGGYAIYDLLAEGFSHRLGFGKFVHTGNESDLTVTDFLELFARDPEVKGILMYLETIRDGQRFMKAAREAAEKKPVVVYKAGRTKGSARAAQSHTGALAGSDEVFQGMFRQLGLLSSPTMELLLPLGHALIERPPLAGPRIGIVTMGGSWGVSLTDALEENGLVVPEPSRGLQDRLAGLGLPARASTRNPVDFGASGLFLSTEVLVGLSRELLGSGEIDALIVHGLGRHGLIDESSSEEARIFAEIQTAMALEVQALEREYQRPVLIGTHHSHGESQLARNLTQKGVRVYNRLDETAQILALMLRDRTRRAARER